VGGRNTVSRLFQLSLASQCASKINLKATKIIWKHFYEFFLNRCVFKRQNNTTFLKIKLLFKPDNAAKDDNKDI
jgi:hypothetical protein